LIQWVNILLLSYIFMTHIVHNSKVMTESKDPIYRGETRSLEKKEMKFLRRCNVNTVNLS